VVLNSVFYDRKAKTGAAGFFGMAFIYTVEAFKDTALMFGGNTDTGVFYGNNRTTIFFTDCNRYFAAVLSRNEGRFLVFIFVLRCFLLRSFT